MTFDQKEYNFGEAIGVDKIEHIFKFRNEGKGELKIEKVNTTCGCTAALLSSKQVPPGGTGEITATFTIGSRQGPQTKHIYVLSNDPSEPKATLTIKGAIIPQVSVSPTSLSLSNRDGAASRSVTIAQTLPEELTLGKISQRLNLLNTKLAEAAPENGKKRYSLEISLKPDVEPGRYFETVSVETNSKTKSRIDIPVRIMVHGDIQANPPRVNLGSLKSGQEISKPITLKNEKGRPFVVESVEIDNAAFSVSPAPPTSPAVSHAFTLAGKAPEKQGVVRAKIVFRTDNPKQKQVEITLYGYIPREVKAVPAPAGKGD